MKSALVSVLIFLLWATGAFILRCHNVRDVLVEGRIYFVDSDCYSRMTRVRMVEAHPGLIIRHQDFENYPRGVDTHATAPMDYVILATKWVVVALLRILDPHGTSILEPQVLDVAGALVSPFLGAAACGFLALFARSIPVGVGYRWAVPLCFAISPITIWGTILGRPDHQSLQVALLAVALAAECRLASGQTRRWAVVSGVSWGLAIWVSLYEPAVLFGVVMVSWLWMKPRALVARARHAGWIAFAIILGLAMLLEGWPATLPDPKMHAYLTNWGKTIGELHHLNLLSPALYGWLGATCLAAPIFLAMTYQSDRRALPGLILLLLTFGLTCWQLRWGYFMGLVFALTLPWQIAALEAVVAESPGDRRGDIAGRSRFSRRHPRLRAGLAAFRFGACDVGVVLAAVLPRTQSGARLGAAVADFCGGRRRVDRDHRPVQFGPILENLFLASPARRDSPLGPSD